MTNLQMRDYLNFRGAKAGIYTGAQPPSVARFNQWLADRRKIALLINAGTTIKPEPHWARLEAFKCGTNGKRVAIFGDPWNGKSWEAPAEVLGRRIYPGGVVIAKQSN